MKKYLLLFLLLSSSLSAQSFLGRVIYVYDGDTIKVLVNGASVKIRLYGIDAPEHNQNYGNSAKIALFKLCHGKYVKVEMMDKDIKYNRIVAKVYLGNVCLNKLMLQEGLAWAYRYFLHGDDFIVYTKIEGVARYNKKGLWRDIYQTAPWNFRRKRK